MKKTAIILLPTPASGDTCPDVYPRAIGSVSVTTDTTITDLVTNKTTRTADETNTGCIPEPD